MCSTPSPSTAGGTSRTRSSTGRSPSRGTRRRTACTRRRRSSSPCLARPEPQSSWRGSRCGAVPLTPLHPVPVWLPYVRWPRAFSFWALTFGSMANDLEYVFAFLTTGHLTHGRGIMHSVLGVLTINALATIVFVYLFVP